MSGESFSSLSLCVGDGWRTYCHTYEERTPILGIDVGAVHVSISFRGRTADQAAVDFARALADKAQEFAAEVERMHAAQPGDTKAAGSDAA
jgi:hypothetical protein